MYKFLMPSQRRKKFKTFVCYTVNLPAGKAIETRLRGNKIILINNDMAIRAFSAVCPHLGCSVVWNPKIKGFLCPCHLASFDVNGQVVSGPPPRPLDQYSVLIEGKSIFVFVSDNYWSQEEA